MDQEFNTQFKKIDQRFDDLISFLRENMVTRTEFNEFKQEVSQGFDKLEKTVSDLTAAVERLARLVREMAEEHSVLKHQMLAMQDWIRKAAEKIGVEFKL